MLSNACEREEREKLTEREEREKLTTHGHVAIQDTSRTYGRGPWLMGFKSWSCHTKT